MLALIFLILDILRYVRYIKVYGSMRGYMRVYGVYSLYPPSPLPPPFPSPLPTPLSSLPSFVPLPLLSHSFRPPLIHSHVSTNVVWLRFWSPCGRIVGCCLGNIRIPYVWCMMVLFSWRIRPTTLEILLFGRVQLRSMNVGIFRVTALSGRRIVTQ